MRLKHSFFVSALALLLASCAQEETPGNLGYGTLDIRVAADYDVVPVVRSAQQTSTEEDLPAVEEFSLNLTSTTGEYTRTWETLDRFDPKSKIPTGEYTASAFYGSLDEEGFHKPYFYGETTATVLDRENTSVDIECALANVKVTVEYTEAFKNYFADWSTTIQSTGGEYIEFSKWEARAAYVRPGNIKIQTHLKKPNGVASTFEPATITNALARHHYKIKLDIDDNMGDAEVTITFDESTETLPVRINVSDEVMTAPAPSFLATGFQSGVAVEAREFSYTENKDVNISITSKGGLAACTLTTTSECLLAEGWPKEVDLLNLTQLQRNILTQLGLSFKGFNAPGSPMALIDFTEVFTHLQVAEGGSDSHSFVVSVRDQAGKVSESPITLSVKSLPITFALQAPESIYVGSNSVTIPVQFNGNNIDQIEFSYINDAGKKVIAPATLVSLAEGDYLVQLAVEVGNKPLQIEASIGGGKKVKSITIPVETPAFTISAEEGDIWAKKATVKLTATDSQYQAAVEKYAVLYVNNNGNWEKLTTTSSKDLRSFANLAPDTQYQLRGTCNDNQENTNYCEVYTLQTEVAADVPNGDFETLVQTINISSINQGGKWSDINNWIAQQTTTSYKVSEPTGWASVNAKTCNYNGANAKNTWFVLPSTLNSSDFQSGSNAMILKNVSWDLAGSVPDRHTNTGKHPYNGKTPETIGNTSAGKLFLGSYSYNTSDASENYNEGVAFNSRPLKITGYYKYTINGQDPNETGLVQVTLMNGETEIATATGYLQAASDYTKFEFPINYTVTNQKATSLKIMICSSNHASYNQSDETATIRTTKYATETQQSATGAILTIDNLTFAY